MTGKAIGKVNAVTAGVVFVVVPLHLLTGSVSFRVLECSPFVRASRRLSASLYTYSSDLARNSGRLPITQTINTSLTGSGQVRISVTPLLGTALPRDRCPRYQVNIWRAVSQEGPVMSPNPGIAPAHTCLSPADWICPRKQNK